MARQYTTDDLRSPAPLWAALKPVIIGSAVTSLLLGAFYAAEIPLGRNYYDNSATVSLGVFAVSVVSLGIYLAAIILTCRITYRMMRNLHALQAPTEMMSPVGAFAYYFVPFISLVLPIKAVKQMQRGTDALLTDMPSAESPQTGLWWGAWIVSNITSGIGFRLTSEPSMADSTLPAFFSSFGAIISVLACAAMIEVFRRLVDAQSRLMSSHR